MKFPRTCILPILFAIAVLTGACSQGGAPSSGDKQPAPEVENIWTIGIYTGSSPFDLHEPSQITNPVLTGADATDMELNIVAHPILLVRDGKYYMFFTAKNEDPHQGGIGSAVSSDGLHWQYNRIVVDEDYDLAYPFVFEWQGQIYMTVESHTEPGVRIYKATGFPDSWEYQGDLLTGDIFISPTVFRYHDIWWMFTAKLGNDTLRLFYASELMGPWTEHPMSPVIVNNLDTARPAGRPLVVGGTLYRIGQDCDPTYGNAAHAFRVLELSTTAYREEMVEKPLVSMTGKGWNSAAMHQVDAYEVSPGNWIAAVDALGAPVGK